MASPLRAQAEVPLVPFREPKETIAPATHFRSTWLSTSVRGIRERGLLGAYLEALPPRHHDAVLNSIAGIWLPIEVALAHYRALDALSLTVKDVVEMGREAGQRAQGGAVATAVRSAARFRSQWRVLEQMPKIWDRMWVGGATAVFKLGDADARVEIVRWPCAAVAYCRVALRGVLLGWAEMAGPGVTVTEVSSQCGPTCLTYRVSWS